MTSMSDVYDRVLLAHSMVYSSCINVSFFEDLLHEWLGKLFPSNRSVGSMDPRITVMVAGLFSAKTLLKLYNTLDAVDGKYGPSARAIGGKARWPQWAARIVQSWPVQWVTWLLDHDERLPVILAESIIGAGGHYLAATVIQFSGSEPLLVYKMAYENVIPQLSNPTSILHNLLPYEVIERSDSIEPFSVGQIKGRTRMHALLGILHVIFEDRPVTNLAED